MSLNWSWYKENAQNVNSRMPYSIALRRGQQVTKYLGRWIFTTQSVSSMTKKEGVSGEEK